ncbi:hypothetical protein Bbelb_162230 [Branchiostoma belcheri]|nr:hypothetical protein Bbelb_162230 [Branchiostoma belcheri]
MVVSSNKDSPTVLRCLYLIKRAWNKPNSSNSGDDFRVDCELCRHWGLSRRTGAKQNCAGGVEERRGRSRFFAGAKQNGAGAKQNGGGEEEGVSWGCISGIPAHALTCAYQPDRASDRPTAEGRREIRSAGGLGSRARAVRVKNPRAVPLVITRAETPVSNVIEAQRPPRRPNQADISAMVAGGTKVPRIRCGEASARGACKAVRYRRGRADEKGTAVYPGSRLMRTCCVPNRACPKPCLSQTVPGWAQNGTQHDCPEPCPEVLSIIVIGGTRNGLGQGHHVSRTVLSPQARFGTRAECPKPCPGMVWDNVIACPELCAT